MSNDIETLKALKDECACNNGAVIIVPDVQIAALTRIIALLEAVDAVKVDEKVWRGWAEWHDSQQNWIGPSNRKVTNWDEQVVILPAAAYDALTADNAKLFQCAEDWRVQYEEAQERENDLRDEVSALTARCAAFEQQVTTMREASLALQRHVEGILRAFELELRQDIGHTNYAVIQHYLDEARRALAQEGGEGGDV